VHPVPLLALAVAAGTMAIYGGAAPAASASSALPRSPAGAVAASERLATASVAASSTIDLTVPPGYRSGTFSTPRQLTVPRGWTAEVWALVPDARMEAWTAQGDLLVSQPSDGDIVELTPDAQGTATSHALLSGLDMPQGLAFGHFGGHSVLYVAESDQIDRYPWGPHGIAGARTVIAADLPDLDPSGDDVHWEKDVVVAPDGSVYFGVGSSSNANPDDRTMSPPRAVIMAVQPNGTGLHVVETGVRNGEGLAVAPNGTVWTAVNNRDNIPYPFESPYDGHDDPLGQVIPAYVDDHPVDEVVPVAAGRDLGWPYCDPDQDENHPAGSLADIPFVADSLTNLGDSNLNCARLPSIQVGLPAHSAPLGLTFLESSSLPAPWSAGAVVAVHGSWDRQPPRAPAVLWMRWNAKLHTLEPAVTLVGGFQNPDGSRWGRPVDAVPGPDGALYVSDDTAGAIYRLVPLR
jgi:glucose/arabinose dehydrogenase